MALRGRKPTPAEIRELTGLKSSHPPANPKPQKIKRPLSGKPPPKWMNAMQKELWKEGLALAPRSILREIDFSVYQVWVMAQYSAIRAAQRHQDAGGEPVLVSPNGKLYQSPFLAIIRQENLVMLRAAAEMGFTPTARMRVKEDGDGDDDKPQNPFDQFGPQAPGKPN